MSELTNASKTILKVCMGFKPNEKLLIVFDKLKKKIADSLYKESIKISSNVKLLETPVARLNGEEPPKEVAEKMRGYDVIIIATTKSMSHTKARKNAVEKGARIASMPGITEEMMKRTMTADYAKISGRSEKIRMLLDKAKKIRVLTDKGADIIMDSNPTYNFTDTGLYREKKKWGNLPGGEAGIMPVEGSSNGVFIVDASLGEIGKVSKPIKITVKDGFATNIDGGKEANLLKKILKKLNDRNAYNIAELGIGTNDKAVISGIVLEDEKVMGTVHIALGNNASYGGKSDVPIHVDGVILKPTVYFDGKKIMEKGKFLIF